MKISWWLTKSLYDKTVSSSSRFSLAVLMYNIHVGATDPMYKNRELEALRVCYRISTIITTFQTNTSKMFFSFNLHVSSSRVLHTQYFSQHYATIFHSLHKKVSQVRPMTKQWQLYFAYHPDQPKCTYTFRSELIARPYWTEGSNHYFLEILTIYNSINFLCNKPNNTIGLTHFDNDKK